MNCPDEGCVLRPLRERLLDTGQVCRTEGETPPQPCAHGVFEGPTDSCLQTLQFKPHFSRRCICCPEQVDRKEGEDVINEFGRQQSQGHGEGRYDADRRMEEWKKVRLCWVRMYQIGWYLLGDEEDLEMAGDGVPGGPEALRDKERVKMLRMHSWRVDRSVWRRECVGPSPCASGGFGASGAVSRTRGYSKDTGALRRTASVVCASLQAKGNILQRFRGLDELEVQDISTSSGAADHAGLHEGTGTRQGDAS